MRADLLLEQFDTLVRTPEDVAELESAILDLAVRGQLVPQDPDDEPASVLLERIKAEKVQLVKEGTIKISKAQLPIKSAEISCRLPDGWEWVTLDQLLASIRGGRSPKAEKRPAKKNERGVLKVSAVTWGEFLPDENKALFSDTAMAGVPTVQANDLLISRANTAKLVGAVVLVKENYPNLHLSDKTLRLDFVSDDVFKPYMICALRASWIRDVFESGATGTSSSMRNISQAKIRSAPVAVPPLAEQKRIVARVDELLAQTRALADQLEAAGEALVPAAQASFQVLVDAPDKAQRSEAWQRVSAAFDALTSDPHTVDALKKTVLQLAVQGKLVPQDPDDEPASVLLERIRDEQKRLAEQGRAPKPKQTRSIDEEQKPFGLPQVWAWTRLPEVGELARGKSKHRPRNDPRLFEGGKYPFVQTGDVARSGGVITTYNAMYGDSGLAQSRMWKAGTLCITIAANIAETGILQFDACFPDSVVGFVPSSMIGSTEYFQYFIQVAKTQLEAYAPATAQKNINLRVLSDLLIPLPPANEAKRIVTKVNSLLALCDELAAEVVAAEGVRGRLLAAVLNGE